MKKALSVLLLLFLCFNVNSQEKNRNLSLSLIEGINVDGKLNTQMSAYLDYELNNGITINSWTGVSFGKDEWISSVNTINKGNKNFTLGAGFMLNSLFDQEVFQKKNLYGIIRFKYKIKL